MDSSSLSDNKMVSVMVPGGVPNGDCIGETGAFLTLEGGLLKKAWYHLLIDPFP
jgi:hypothetical protein